MSLLTVDQKSASFARLPVVSITENVAEVNKRSIENSKCDGKKCNLANEKRERERERERERRKGN
jgi:hypothetical protein